jgi:hypothetical protein
MSPVTTTTDTRSNGRIFRVAKKVSTQVKMHAEKRKPALGMQYQKTKHKTLITATIPKLSKDTNVGFVKFFTSKITMSAARNMRAPEKSSGNTLAPTCPSISISGTYSPDFTKHQIPKRNKIAPSTEFTYLKFFIGMPVSFRNEKSARRKLKFRSGAPQR